MKTIITALALLASLGTAHPEGLKIDRCSGVLTTFNGELVLGEPTKGGGIKEGICILPKIDARYITARCPKGSRCEVVGLVDPDEESCECMTILRVRSVRNLTRLRQSGKR